ncbi:CYSTEINE DESULFURASE [Salix viminalis]|uniref:CYSTEINE DESULFURASE n=1 Tax=Salix viminalis TaxID=40686 RepID=A0A9Q0UVS5_SALVM|nr:CYSTEINE DESULFURASE [Salix viminalis]
MLHEAAEYIKKCLGGGSDDAILFCGSGTTAAIKRLQEVMGIAVPSTLRDRLIKCLGDEERWLVFVGPYEHHSNLLSWRQSLAEVVEIGLDDNGAIDIEDLRRRLESYKHANRPILGSFSACSNVTGIFSDTRGIARLLHQHGGFACFDFAASGPYVKIDMRSGEIDGYDAVFLSPHKFIGGPGTPGILLMSKALYQLGSSAPSTCGGGTVDFVNGFAEKHTLYLTEIEERENGGTPQIIQTIRAALTFWVKEYITCRVIEEKENMYTAKALNRLLPNKNIWILGNTTGKRQAILSFLVYSTTNSSSARTKHGTNRKNINDEVLYMWGETGNRRDKPLHGPYVAALLNDLFGIQARGGCACAGPYGHSLLHVDEPSSLAFRSAIKKGYVGVKPGWTRVSFPYYMSSEEFEFILAAIEFIAIYGQRFLPLYHFNWKTGGWTFKKKGIQGLGR